MLQYHRNTNLWSLERYRASVVKTPPSDWIYEYFEIKCGQPEWPCGTQHSSSGKFVDRLVLTV